MTGIFVILALSLDIIIGHMGQLSLGHAAFFGIGAYTSGLLAVRLGLPVWLGFLAAIVSTGAIGTFIGYVSLRRLRGMYLAVVTFGFGAILWLVARQWHDVTGGMSGLTGIPPPRITIPFLPKIEFSSDLSYYYLVLALLLFTIYFISRLLRSRFGRALRAVREHEDLASSIGVDPFRHYLIAFTLATALAGFAGAIYAHYLQVVNPMLLGTYYMFILLIMVIVGGAGTLWGPVFGAAFFVWVGELMRFSEELRYLFFGIILLVCILFMPQGLFPFLASLWNRFIVRRKPGAAVK